MPVGPAVVNRKEQGRPRLIGYRPSLVIINESRPTEFHSQKADQIHQQIEKRWSTETGFKPFHVSATDRNLKDVIQEVTDRIHESAGSNKEGNTLGPGNGQTVVLRGSFTPEQIKKIKWQIKPLRVLPTVIETARHATSNQLIERHIRNNTFHSVSQRELGELAHLVESEPFTHRAGFLISNFIHHRVINGEKSVPANAKFKPGSSGLVMFDRPDLFGSSEEGSEEEFLHPEKNYYAYRTETGTQAGRYRKIPRLHSNDTSKRIVRAFMGIEGNQDENGHATHLMTRRLSRIKPRLKNIDNALGYTPRTEGVLFIGTIPPELQKKYSHFLLVPEGRLAACHFYSSHMLTGAAFREMQRVAEHPVLNRKIVDLWKDEELLYTKHADLARAVLNLERHDPYTKMHSRNVAEWTQLIGRKLKIDRDTLNAYRWGALVHDIGKTKVPTEILHKVGDLLGDEWGKIKRHPEDGADILQRNRSSETIIGCAKYHHEKFNGNGYPDGLAGEKIPLGARIVSVADIIDAFLTEREYPRRVTMGNRTVGKLQFSWERVKDVIRDFMAIGDLDPKVAQAALSLTPKDFGHIYENYQAPSRKEKGIYLRKRDEPPWLLNKNSKWFNKNRAGQWTEVRFKKKKEKEAAIQQANAP